MGLDLNSVDFVVAKSNIDQIQDVREGLTTELELFNPSKEELEAAFELTTLTDLKIHFDNDLNNR